MKQLLAQIKWQFLLLHRNNIISISFAVTVFYILAFYGLRDLSNIDKVLTAMILNDPATISLFFIGLSIILDRNQQVLAAWFVSPINLHVLLISRIIALSIIGWLSALAMAYAAFGTDFNFWHFSAGVWGICLLSCLVGLYLACYNTDFLLFTLKSIPILMLCINVPMLNYFGVINIPFIEIIPVQGSIELIANSYVEAPSTKALVFGYLTTLIWVPILYWLVYRTFLSKIVYA